MYRTLLMVLLLVTLTTWGCGNRNPLESTPAASVVAGQAGPGDAERCSRHDLPSTACFICEAALREPGRLWCAEHDRYEDRCFLCHPELRNPDRPYCEEHHLYEDECTLCRPELVESGQTPATAAAELVCREHRVLESECGICHPDLAAGLRPGASLKIRFESDRSAAMAGIETAQPQVTSDRLDTTFLARVTWDENNYARVTPLASGVLLQVTADVGQSVSRGDRLATLSSPEIARSKSTYLSARADEELKRSILAREHELATARVSSRQELEQARAEHEIARNTTAMARQQLLNFGLTADAIRLVEHTGAPSSELHILAPQSGTVVARDAVAGEAVAPGDALFEVARLASMWLELAIPEHQASLVRAGQDIVATFDAEPGMEISGRVSWIGSSVDATSRVVTGRAVVANTDRRLRHGMFGRARLVSSTPRSGLLLPSAALQHIDERPFVFTRLADDLFELRRVELGATIGADVVVVAGIEADEQIVVTHSFTLKSELLKSRLGAGCVDE